MQGLVNLADNQTEDGGFWLVPGFHRYLPKWAAQQPQLREQHGTRSQFNIFSKMDIPELYEAACHISTRAGSAILWNQRTMHGSRANCSLRPRFSQFFKMFPAEHPSMTPERAQHRRAAILKKLREAHINPDTEITALGKKLFGLLE